MPREPSFHRRGCGLMARASALRLAAKRFSENFTELAAS
jgi:hypothetical protein